jgi:hypothetical protein
MDFFRGMTVKLTKEAEQSIENKDFLFQYDSQGFLYVRDIDKEEILLETGGIASQFTRVNKDNIEPVYLDGNILLILEEKREELRHLEEDIKTIVKLINERYCGKL